VSKAKGNTADEEVIEVGEAFYIPAGHVPAAKAATEFVMFSSTDKLVVSEAAIKATMQRLMGEG
jgi:quercetin dioxygenase-like cupin family protein